ncbi:hypothetical protein B0H17DRAFT_1339701 [Mycena rosella]|uniref:Uncharacterized protein n=1 Tax=Mycena rosella TaxID=1033263 RepID=A0AAD7FRB0_MYCRO|nr:hypothetical protein B0H17DRAFT_1339701 [Mycena rosella]
MQAPPLNAIFSGYSMRPEYFRKLASALRPHLAARRTTQLFMQYVGDYDCWRRDLPEEDHAKAPLLKVLDDSDWEDTKDTKLFFSTRWVPADVDSSKPDFTAMELESDIDRNRRDELIALIQRRSGFSVDKNLLQFECIQDVHPFHDPLAGF